MFNDHPTTTSPFPSAGRLKSHQDYDPNIVREALQHPEKHETVPMDPRTLRSTQPSVTREGVKHYMQGGDYERTKETFGDKGNPGNTRPVVYTRSDGQNLLLSGHHRAAAALLQGQQFNALHLEGPYGPPRGQH